MKNTAKLKIVIGNLKALIVKGEDFMFVAHHVDCFLNKINDMLYTVEGGTYSRLNEMAFKVDSFSAEINYSPFYVQQINKCIEALEPLVKHKVMNRTSRLNVKPL